MRQGKAKKDIKGKKKKSAHSSKTLHASPIVVMRKLVRKYFF